MFDKALLRRPGIIGDRYDVGRVLETILYYRRVHLLLDMQFLLGLAQVVQPTGIKAILDLPHVSAELIAPTFAVVQTDRASGLEVHRAAYITYHGHKERIFDDEVDAIHEFMARHESVESTSPADWQKILKSAKRAKYTKLVGSQEYTHALLSEILQDREVVRSVIRNLAQEQGLALSLDRLSRFEFSPISLDDGGIIIGSPAWTEILGNVELPPDFAWGKVISRLLEYTLDLQLAGKALGDVVVGSELAELAMERVALTLQRANNAQAQIDTFQELAFDDARYFSGAFNEGRLSFSDAMSVIERSSDLRKWTVDLSPTSQLASEYVAAVSAQPYMERLSPSIMRFLTFSGIGAGLSALGPIGSLAGTALSAFDQFVFGRLVSGWRPSTFVNRVKEATTKRGR